MNGPDPQAARHTVAWYRFQNGTTVDPAHLPLVRELALLGAPEHAEAAVRLCRAATGLVGYRERHGLPVTRATVLDPSTVADHLAALAETLGAGSVRVHAAALSRITAADLGHSRPRQPTSPYSTSEVEGLLDWADRAPDPHVRHGLLGILAFGLGAGLDADTLLHLDAPDVTQPGAVGPVLATIHGPDGTDGARTVAMLRPYETLARDLAAAAGTGWALRPAGAPPVPRAWKPIVSAGCPNPRLPDLNPRRCRRTWLHNHLEGATPLVPLMRAAGFDHTTNLVKPIRRLAPLPAADRDTELRGV